MFFKPLRKTIRHKIQLDVMLKERFEAGQHQREPLSRVGYLFHKFVPVATEAGLRDTDERCAILLRRKYPFHGGEIAVSWPLDDNALVRFDGFRSHGG